MVVGILGIIIGLAFIICALLFVKYKDNRRDSTLLRTAINNLGSYVFLIDEQFLVRETNYYALNKLEKSENPKILGNVLECKNGTDAGECGKHLNCRRCPIRNTITKAFNNRGSFVNVETTMRIYDSNKHMTCIDVCATGRFVYIGNKPHMVVSVKDITEDKQLLHTVLEERKEAERIVLQNAGTDSDRLLRLEFVTGMGNNSNKPKILFDTQNVARYNKVKSLLRDDCKLVYADRESDAIYTSVKNDSYGYKAIMLDETFVYTDSTIVDSIMRANPMIDLIIFTADADMKDENTLHYIHEDASPEEVLKKVRNVLGVDAAVTSSSDLQRGDHIG